MKQIVYATHYEPWMQGMDWHNARWFAAVDPDATQVYVAGGFPSIEAAYRAVGVPVTVVGPGGLPRPPVTIPEPPRGLQKRRRRARKEIAS